MKDLLIGKDVEIVASTNKTLIGLKGKIVDETQSTLIIDCGSEKRVLKNICEFKVDDKIIKGSEINKRSFDRIK
jgi:RNase P/RNase MRP subunit p29